MSKIEYYIGIDWGVEKNQVCVTDADGKVKENRLFTDLPQLVLFIEKWCEEFGPEFVKIGIERRDLALVDVLLDRDYSVFEVNPKKVDRFRDRLSMAGAKDDRRDAQVIASALRTDSSAFAAIGDDPYANLRTLTRARKTISKRHASSVNQLYDKVLRISPAFLVLVGGCVSPIWIQEVLELFLTSKRKDPYAMRRAPLQKLLKKRRVKKFSVDDILEALGGGVRPSSRALANAQKVIPSDLERLRSLRAQMREFEEQIGEELNHLKTENPNIALLESIPGFGDVSVSTIFAEIGSTVDSLDKQQLRCLSGAAPVTISSGKSHRVQQRRACNQRVRDAFFYASKGATTHDEYFKALHEENKAKGQGYARSLRGIGDRLISLVIGVLKSGEPYDKTRHGNRSSRELLEKSVAA